jgi:hypothetical protein
VELVHAVNNLFNVRLYSAYKERIRVRLRNTFAAVRPVYASSYPTFEAPVAAISTLLIHPISQQTTGKLQRLHRFSCLLHVRLQLGAVADENAVEIYAHNFKAL